MSIFGAKNSIRSAVKFAIHDCSSYFNVSEYIKPINENDQTVSLNERSNTGLFCLPVAVASGSALAKE